MSPSLSSSKEEDVAECPICLEPFGRDRAVVQPCKHEFCSSCIVRWRSENSTCPCCRGEIRCLLNTDGRLLHLPAEVAATIQMNATPPLQRNHTAISSDLPPQPQPQPQPQPPPPTPLLSTPTTYFMPSIRAVPVLQTHTIPYHNTFVGLDGLQHHFVTYVQCHTVQFWLALQPH